MRSVTAMRHVNTRYVIGHPAQGLGAAQRADADQDGRTTMQTALADCPHEILKQRQVEAELGLNETRAGVDLAFEICDAVPVRRHEGIGGRTQEQIGGA